MKTKTTKLFSWLMALILLVSVEGLPVSAEEYLIEEETITGGIEINVPAKENVQTVRNLTGAEYNVSLTGNEIRCMRMTGFRQQTRGRRAYCVMALFPVI